MNTHMIAPFFPAADLPTLKLRANMLENIRAFFAKKNILEVETPLMCRAPVTDPFLSAISLDYRQEPWYLQTSPEYAMKRLLASGSGSIYQICKAFRAEEKGKLHHPEFTMLEWYHLHFNHHDLMQETDEFLQAILHTLPAIKYSYQEIFEKYLGINPHNKIIFTEKYLKNLLQQHNILLTKTSSLLDYDDYLNLLITHLIEPQLDKTRPVFIYDYPASQAALSKISLNKDKFPVAERFEVYVEGIELANGYHELTDPVEQKKRFEKDLEKRKILNYPSVPIDHYLLSALEYGLPDCAGIALGFDRLVLIASKKKALHEVTAFYHDNI